MTSSVFEFTDYKAFVRAQIDNSANGGRGIRRKLAEFIGCQIAYVSHVLAADRHFSLEQAEATARFFSLREDETEFFLLLLEHQKAGTQNLKNYLQKKIDERTREHNEIKNRIRIKGEISQEDQATYYSSWHFQTIHTLLTIPGFQQADSIAERLKLSIARVNEVLSFLLQRGLVIENENGYAPTTMQIHLPRTSPLISKLHSNWRIQTLAALENMREDDYHYSGLVTLSSEDAKRVREILMKALADSIDVIRPSKEERMQLLAIDFYEV